MLLPGVHLSQRTMPFVIALKLTAVILSVRDTCYRPHRIKRNTASLDRFCRAAVPLEHSDVGVCTPTAGVHLSHGAITPWDKGL